MCKCQHVYKNSLKRNHISIIAPYKKAGKRRRICKSRQIISHALLLRRWEVIRPVQVQNFRVEGGTLRLTDSNTFITSQKEMVL